MQKTSNGPFAAGQSRGKKTAVPRTVQEKERKNYHKKNDHVYWFPMLG